MTSPSTGDVTPPSISVAPSGGTVYTQTLGVRASYCDNTTLSQASARLLLDGQPVTSTYSAGTAAGCASAGTSAAQLTLRLGGQDTLSTRICDTSGNCSTATNYYSYAADQTAPTITITPASGTLSSGTLSPVITWCDNKALVGPRITFNGTDVTSRFGFVATSGTGCTAQAQSSLAATDALKVLPGTNTLIAEIEDSVGNKGTTTATYTYRPLIDTSPTNQTSTGPGPFDAVLAYSTPSYRSLDVDRTITLAYASSAARPMITLAVDVTDASSDPAPRTSIGLMWHGVMQTLPNGATELHYATGAGTNRLTAVYSASSFPTGAMDMTAVITRYWTDGRSEQLTAPVRILVINDSNSPYGAGWSVVGVERVYPTEGGILITHGGGSGTFYPAYTSCDASKICKYGHSAGDFGTVAYDSTRQVYVRTSQSGVTSTFNSLGQLTSVADLAGNTESYTYDAGRISTILDPAAWLPYFGYDANGKLSRITDAGGRVTQVAVDGSGDLASITDPAGVVALQATYTSHRVMASVDRGGNRSDVTYDAFGKLASVQGPAFTAEGGQTFRLTSSIVSLEQAAEGTSTAGTSAAPLPRVDPATLTASVTDPQGRTTRLALDAWGAPARVQDSFGYVSSTTRDTEGRVTAQRSLRDSTFYYWNGTTSLRVVGTSDSTEYEFDARGHATRITPSSGTETRNYYNATTGALELSVDAGTDSTVFTYDSRLRLVTVTDPEHHTTTYGYDDPANTRWNNLKSVTSGGRTVQYSYDSYGRPAGETDPDNQATTYAYDVLNRPRTVTTPTGTVSYDWGALFLNAVTDQGGQTYQWTRNALGGVVLERRPGDAAGVGIGTEYDRYGRVSASTNRRGQRVTYTYDAHDRVSSRTADGQTTTFGYSPDAPMDPNAPSWVQYSNPESTDTLRFDARGRLTDAVTLRPNGFSQPQRVVVEPRYDTRSFLVGVALTSPAGRDSIGYGYNTRTLEIATMRDLAGGQTSFSFNHDGMLSSTTLPTGQHMSQSYTTTHMLEALRYDAGTTLDNVAGQVLRYDPMNRITERRSAAMTSMRSYQYDATGRWLSWWGDYQQSVSNGSKCGWDPNDGIKCDPTTEAWTQTNGHIYRYDASGNPTYSAGSTVVGTGNRLSQISGYTLGYDDDGNLTSKTAPSFTQTFEWNSLGQLASVNTNGAKVSYGYDGMGRRVRRRENGFDAQYVYNGSSLMVELDASGVQAKYTYYPSGDPQSVVRGGQTYYYATDHQGSVVAVFNSSNQVVNQYAYLPFGEAWSTTEAVANRLRYTGREFDASSGLYYNNARWYDPMLRRFISQDPIGSAGGLNQYAYAGNDPVNSTDPSGLSTDGCERGRHPDPITQRCVPDGTPTGAFYEAFDICWNSYNGVAKLVETCIGMWVNAATQLRPGTVKLSQERQDWIRAFPSAATPDVLREFQLDEVRRALPAMREAANRAWEAKTAWDAANKQEYFDFNQCLVLGHGGVENVDVFAHGAAEAGAAEYESGVSWSDLPPSGSIGAVGGLFIGWLSQITMRGAMQQIARDCYQHGWRPVPFA